MPVPRKRLADLHLHLYGSIHCDDYLDHVIDRPVDWTAYKAAFRDAYGEVPPIQEVLECCRLGEADARKRFEELFVFGDRDSGNFARFQAKYNLLIAGSKWAAFSGADSDFSSLVNEVCVFMRQIVDRQRRQNIGYAEQRMTLSPSLSPGQARTLLEAMLRTYAACETPDFQPRLAVSLSRADPWPAWEATRQAASGPDGRLITAIDFCYLEEGFPPKLQRQLFEAVKEFNRQNPERALAILYHVGESFTDKSLESAVRWVHEAAEMGANRLGHAIALGVDPDKYGPHTRKESVGERIDQLNYDLRHMSGLRQAGVNLHETEITRELEQLRSRNQGEILPVEYDESRLNEIRARQTYAIRCIKAIGAVVEVCPTSNLRIGGITRPEHHSLVKFAAEDVPFVIGSDDPGIFGTTLTREIESAMNIAGFSEDYYDEIVERSWLSRSEVLSGRSLA